MLTFRASFLLSNLSLSKVEDLSADSASMLAATVELKPEERVLSFSLTSETSDDTRLESRRNVDRGLHGSESSLKRSTHEASLSLGDGIELLTRLTVKVDLGRIGSGGYWQT